MDIQAQYVVGFQLISRKSLKTHGNFTGYQLLYIRAKCAALRRCDLHEAQSIGRRMAAAGLSSVGEEAGKLRTFEAIRKLIPFMCFQI